MSSDPVDTLPSKLRALILMFDGDHAYGPKLGISRRVRYDRACSFPGETRPPPAIKHILDHHKEVANYVFK